MQRDALEHLIRASAAITGEKEFVVIGSQAILAKLVNPPRSLIMSIEADIYPMHSPEKADVIDGAIGELSTFHGTYGYYAHGVSPETAKLPRQWQSRAIPLEVADAPGVVAHCLAPIDLAYSKLAAGRTKDMEFIREMIRATIIKRGTLTSLIEAETSDNELLGLLRQRMQMVGRDDASPARKDAQA